MSVNPETYTAEPLAYTEAGLVAAELSERRAMLDERFNGLEGYDIGEVRLVELADLPNGCKSAVLDISDHPGGAFKYASALGADLTLPEGTTTVAMMSAGNYASTQAQACKRLGLHGVAYMPANCNPTKKQSILDNGMDVVDTFDDVEAALPAAREAAAENEGWAFVHAYDSPNGIAALTVLADQVADELQALQVEGRVNLDDYQVDLLVQRGGGSLLAAMATRVKQLKDAGVLPAQVVVHDIRPERLEDGSLDSDFDGLKVNEPGSYAAALLQEPEYVAGSHTVSRQEVAAATRHLSGLTDVAYETNALAGMAAARRLAEQAEKPTLFVSLLTGRNVDPEQMDAFLKTEAEPVVSSGQVATFAGGVALRAVAEEPYRPDPGLQDLYYDQLEKWGVVLVRRTGQLAAARSTSVWSGPTHGVRRYA